MEIRGRMEGRKENDVSGVWNGVVWVGAMQRGDG